MAGARGRKRTLTLWLSAPGAGPGAIGRQEPVTDETAVPTSGSPLGGSGIAGAEAPCGTVTPSVFTLRSLDGALGAGESTPGEPTSGSETPGSGASGAAGADPAGSDTLLEPSPRPAESRAAGGPLVGGRPPPAPPKAHTPAPADSQPTG